MPFVRTSAQDNRRPKEKVDGEPQRKTNEKESIELEDQLSPDYRELKFLSWTPNLQRRCDTPGPLGSWGLLGRWGQSFGWGYQSVNSLGLFKVKEGLSWDSVFGGRSKTCPCFKFQIKQELTASVTAVGLLSSLEPLWLDFCLMTHPWADLDSWSLSWFLFVINLKTIFSAHPAGTKWLPHLSPLEVIVLAHVYFSYVFHFFLRSQFKWYFCRTSFPDHSL